MNKLLIVLSSIALLSSCDNRKEFLKTLTPLPELQVSSIGGRTPLLDSIKYSLKSNKKTASFSVTIGGNRGEKKVTIKSINSVGSLTFNGVNGEGTHTLKTGTHTLSYTPSATGKALFNITVKDNFDNIKEANVEVYTFDNLLPVANLSILNIEVVDDKEYLIDASKSFDSDYLYGGFLATYKYKIGNNTITTDKSSIRWIFPKPGNYEIGVTVTDSDGATSTYSNIFTIN